MPIEPATRAVPCRAALRRAVCPCGCGRGRPTKAEPLRSLLSVARRAEPCLLAVNRPEIEPCPRALALRAASPHRQVLLCLGRRSRQSLRVRLALLGPPPFRPHSHAVPLWMVHPRLQSKAKQTRSRALQSHEWSLHIASAERLHRTRAAADAPLSESCAIACSSWMPTSRTSPHSSDKIISLTSTLVNDISESRGEPEMSTNSGCRRKGSTGGSDGCTGRCGSAAGSGRCSCGTRVAVAGPSSPTVAE